MEVQNTLKKCARCHSNILLEYYEHNRKGEFYKTCNNCRKHTQQHKEDNKERYKYMSKIYDENNKANIKIYREANRDKIKEQRKLYREENRDKINARKKLYRENNKQKIAEASKIYYEKAKDFREANKDTEKIELRRVKDDNGIKEFIKIHGDKHWCYCCKETLPLSDYRPGDLRFKMKHKMDIQCRKCNISKKR